MDLSNMNEHQKSVINITGWSPQNLEKEPEWFILWVNFKENIDKILEKVGGFKGWIETQDRELSNSIQKELDNYARTNYLKISELYHQYRKDHPEEFKPRENE